jgi:hypothetical protein
MQGLFEDKLASQKAALLQGKQLADIIALEGGADSVSSIDLRAPPSSTGVAARTLTQEKARRARGAWVGIAAALGVVAIATASVLWAKRPAGEAETRSAATSETPSTSTPVVAAAAPPPLVTQTAPPPPAPLPVPSTEVATTPLALPPPPPPTEHKAVAGKPQDRSSPPPAAATPGAPAGTGKLNVAARGGWCNVAIDGAGHGPTPLAGVVLTAGTHTVTCTPEGGRPMTTTVRVEADGTARYSFTVPQ